ncbi:MAG: hydroxyacid dehydrogenase [Chloroflexota bacterium]|nr:hydroxyacid dehydrogenase [Chloroflexota bacterium]
MSEPKIALLQTRNLTERMFTEETLARMRKLGQVIINPNRERPTVEETIELIEGAQACVTSWGCQPMTAQVLDAAPDLGIIVYAAGSVKPIVTDAVWSRGITVTSSAAMIAVNVAEMTMGCLILGLKNAWGLSRATRSGSWREEREYAKSRVLNQATVGIISASHVGRKVLEYLRAFEVKEILLYDPYWSVDEISELGAAKVSLEELLQRSDAVTLHAPALPATRHMLGTEELRLMKDDAVLVNTSRGQNIDQQALIAELEEGRLFAFIDVTDPEPPAVDSPLRALPNVVLTPHVAGGGANPRLGDHAFEELRRFFAGEPPLHEVTRDMLAHIACPHLIARA